MKNKIIRVIFIITLLGTLLGESSAQQPIILWKYQLDAGWIANFSMSPNAEYMVFMVVKGEGKDVDIAVHLLNQKSEPIQIYDNFNEYYETGTLTTIGNTISVSNYGDVAVGAKSGTGPIWKTGKPPRYDGLIYLFDKGGELLWKKRMYDMISYGVAISPDGKYVGISGDNKIYLFNKGGQLLWEKTIGESFSKSLRFMQISDNASITVAYEGEEEKIYVFNKSGQLLYTKECLYAGVRTSPNGEYIVILVPSIPWNKLVILASNDGKVIQNCGFVLKRWHFSISNNKEVVLVQEDDLGNKGIMLIDSNGKRVYYSFEVPRGKPDTGYYVDISSDGQIVALATSCEIHYLKSIKLEKKW